MLTDIYIENIAVIEKTSIDFDKGLNVLTGETGAGKSIIIDSINAVLGNRTSKELIRSGCENAYVSAEFSDISPRAEAVLKENGFEPEDGTVMIQREINISGKGKCRINGRPVPVSVLKSIGTALINIHGQHDTYELMSPDLHVTYLDKLGDLEGDLDEYRRAFSRYKELSDKLRQSETDEADRERRMDLLSYQVDEIESAELVPGEYEDLLEQRKVIENKEKILTALDAAKSFLNGDDETEGAIEGVESACSELSSINGVLPESEEITSRLQAAVYELEDCCSEISELFDEADSGGADLEEIEDRIDVIRKLGRKYGSTIDEMLEFLEKARSELQYLQSYEENREALTAECNEARSKAENLAEQLSQKRRETARSFSERVREEMTFLDMPNVVLVVRQDKCELNRFGCDDVEILISANPGEDPRPVSKIASGGELSRMMLAIKNVLADKDDIDTLIFDEVDTGISGSAAQKVGLKLKEVSRSRQVLCVTHQAQIAALADNHFKISKSVRDEKTYTVVDKLDRDGRRSEVARIIGGVEITKATLDYAEEMISASDNK